MPDITMCRGGDCPLKNSCYRFLAKPSELQSYTTPPFKDGKCEIYWENDPKKIEQNSETKMNEKTFYMVFLENGGAPSYKHETLQSAETEAKRLSKVHSRKAFVLCTIKSFELVEFKVEDCRPVQISDLPF